MPTSTRFVVSVHTLALLANMGGRPMRSEDLAVSANTNPSVIRALLVRLAAAGLTTSQMGNGGGALLAKPADAITLLDAFLAVEDREIFGFHRSPPDDRDTIGRHIVESLADPLRSAREAMERELALVTIADIVARVHLLNSNRFDGQD